MEAETRRLVAHTFSLRFGLISVQHWRYKQLDTSWRVSSPSVSPMKEEGRWAWLTGETRDIWKEWVIELVVSLRMFCQKCDEILIISVSLKNVRNAGETLTLVIDNLARSKFTILWDFLGTWKPPPKIDCSALWRCREFPFKTDHSAGVRAIQRAAGKQLKVGLD